MATRDDWEQAKTLAEQAAIRFTDAEEALLRYGEGPPRGASPDQCAEYRTAQVAALEAYQAAKREARRARVHAATILAQLQEQPSS